MIAADSHLMEDVQSLTRKIIIATPVVETGYTIDGLSFVIDSLKYFANYYNPLTKATVNRAMPVDAQMLQQRSGRVGRTAPGVYFGLIEEPLKAMLLPRSVPKIQIQELKLFISKIGLEQFMALDFIYPTPPELVLDALQYLRFVQFDPRLVHEFQWLAVSSDTTFSFQSRIFV